MDLRLANLTFVVSAVCASVGHAANYATGLYENQQPKATAYTASVPQVSSPLPNVQKSNGEAQAAMLWTDGERTGYIENDNAFDGRGNQIGRNVVPGEEIRAVGQGRIGYTQGGNDVIKNSSGDTIGIVRPSGEAHWFGAVKNEAVPKIGNQNGNELGNDSALRQPQTPLDAEQLQEGQQPFTRQQADGLTGQEGKRKDEETCKAHEPMDKRVVNKIAHDNLRYFNSDMTVEMQMHVMRDGRYTSAAWGDKYTVGGANDIKVSITDDIKAIMVIHSHPFDNKKPLNNEYSRWPSFMDIVAHLERGMKIKYMLKCVGCSYSGENYSYIAHFTEYSGKDVVVKRSDGNLELRQLYTKVEKPILVRFDETGVYKISENGTEARTGSMPKEWKDRPFDGDHRPFDFGDDKEWVRAKGMAERWFRDHYARADMKSGSVVQSHKEPDSSSTDVKKTLEEFHARFLSLPNNQFKWQEIQVYLDWIVSMQTLGFPQDKVSKWKVSACNLSWKDLVDPAQSFAKDKGCWAQEKFGIRGWCKCQPLHVTKRDSCFVDVSTEATQDNGGAFCNLLGFRVCEKCGKCYTYRKLGDDSYDVTFTVWPYKETAEERISQTHKFRAALAKMEDAILSIPDGEIVVPIKKMCSCKLRSGEKPHLVAIDDGPKGKTIICTVCCGLYSTR